MLEAVDSVAMATREVERKEGWKDREDEGEMTDAEGTKGVV